MIIVSLILLILGMLTFMGALIQYYKGNIARGDNKEVIALLYLIAALICLK